MPNIKSAKKRVLVNRTRAARTNPATQLLKQLSKRLMQPLKQMLPKQTLSLRKLSKRLIRLLQRVLSTRTMPPAKSRRSHSLLNKQAVYLKLINAE